VHHIPWCELRQKETVGFF